MNGERGADLSAAVCCPVAQLLGCWAGCVEVLNWWGETWCDVSAGGRGGWQNNPEANFSINLLAHHLPAWHQLHRPRVPTHLSEPITGRKGRFFYFPTNCAAEGLDWLSRWLCPLPWRWAVLPNLPCAAGLLSEEVVPCQQAWLGALWDLFWGRGG